MLASFMIFELNDKTSLLRHSIGHNQKRLKVLNTEHTAQQSKMKMNDERFFFCSGGDLINCDFFAADDAISGSGWIWRWQTVGPLHCLFTVKPMRPYRVDKQHSSHPNEVKNIYSAIFP